MRVLLPVLGAALLSAGPVAAQTAATPPAAVPPPARTVTLAPDAHTVADLARSIAAQTGQRILVAPDVSGTIGINLSNFPLENALTAITTGTGNTWSRLTLPREQADKLTPEAAAALSRAADALAASTVSVRNADGREVAVGAAPTKDPNAVTVYVVRSDKPAATVREDMDKKEAEARGSNMNLAPDAKSDPAVVGAYSALKSLSPDQMAVLTREFILHLSPNEQQVLGEAFQKQRQQMKDQPPRQ